MPTLPPMPGMSNGIAGASSTSISTSTSFIAFSTMRWRKLSRVASLAFSPTSALSSRSIAALLGRLAHGLAAAVLLEPDRLFGQVAGDLLDVAADIADLGELGRLDLDERRVGQLRQPAADLGLAATGRADHQDVLGRHLVAQLGAEPLAPPAIAQRHGDRALGLGLADDVLVERGDDGLGGEMCRSCLHSLPCGSRRVGNLRSECGSRRPFQPI